MATGRISRLRRKHRYANLDGDSPIVAFELGRRYVRLWFKRKAVPYRYTSRVVELTQLARAGRGLATFISRHRDELRFRRD